MSSDNTTLEHLSTLGDRLPLEVGLEISESEENVTTNEESTEVLDSGRNPRTGVLSHRVSSAFYNGQKNCGSVHAVDQKTIENIFQEIQYHTEMRCRLKKKKHKDHASDIDDQSVPKTGHEVAPNFRSSFADIVQKPVTDSILDSPDFLQGQFFGFYVVFWLSVAFLMLKHVMQSFLTDQLPVYKSPVYLIFTNGLLKIAITDLFMYLSIYVVYFIQVLCAGGLIEWHKSGRILTSVYEFSFMVFWIYFVGEVVVKDQWIGRTFLILHLFVLLMKMHSYAFYNGYLWNILRELKFSEAYLKKLQADTAKLPAGFERENTTKLLTGSIAFCKFELLHQSLTLEKANEKGTLEMDSVALCKTYLLFPKNINFGDFFMYTMYPTVLYSLKFIRTKRIRWFFVLEKISAMIGVIFIMLMIAEYSVYSIVMNCHAMSEINLSLGEKINLFVVTLLDIVPPMFLEYLLTFYLIWHVILNLIAEVTRFADRDFYGHWWAILDWEEFSRLWNKPVHKFLLRHVYHSSISTFSLSKSSSAFLTFFISSVLHELMMYVIFGHAKGYLFFFQMFQIPLILINQSPMLNNHKTLRNILCWLGMILAPGLIPAFYLVF